MFTYKFENQNVLLEEKKKKEALNSLLTQISTASKGWVGIWYSLSPNQDSPITS